MATRLLPTGWGWARFPHRRQSSIRRSTTTSRHRLLSTAAAFAGRFFVLVLGVVAVLLLVLLIVVALALGAGLGFAVFLVAVLVVLVPLEGRVVLQLLLVLFLDLGQVVVLVLGGALVALLVILAVAMLTTVSFPGVFLGWAIAVPLGFMFDPIFDRVGMAILTNDAFAPFFTWRSRFFSIVALSSAADARRGCF